MLLIKRQINRESQPRAPTLDNKGHLRLESEAGCGAGSALTSSVHTKAKWGINNLLFAVGVVTRLRTTRYGVRAPLGTVTSGPDLRPTRAPVEWVPESLSMGIKRLGRETDHSQSSSAEVKNEWSYTSTAVFDFMALTTLPFYFLPSSYYSLAMRRPPKCFLPLRFSDQKFCSFICS
jgi:hypothetical protein